MLGATAAAVQGWAARDAAALRDHVLSDAVARAAAEEAGGAEAVGRAGVLEALAVATEGWRCGAAAGGFGDVLDTWEAPVPTGLQQVLAPPAPGRRAGRERGGGGGL